MKVIELSRGMVAMVDDADYEWLSKFHWHTQKGRNTFYAARNIWRNGKNTYTYMHREILGLHDKSVHVDHKDGNGLNNQRQNIRSCSTGQNRFNMKHRIGGTSPHRGVDYVTRLDKWRARINKNKVVYDLGHFDSEDLAAIAYNEKAKELYGEFANFNNVSL